MFILYLRNLKKRTKHNYDFYLKNIASSYKSNPSNKIYLLSFYYFRHIFEILVTIFVCDTQCTKVIRHLLTYMLSLLFKGNKLIVMH